MTVMEEFQPEKLQYLHNMWQGLNDYTWNNVPLQILATRHEKERKFHSGNLLHCVKKKRSAREPIILRLWTLKNHP